MKGFLYKDICVFRTMWKSYAILMAVFFVLTIFGIYDLSFMGTFVPILLCMGTLSSMNVDEQAQWDRFAVSVPNGRAKVVREKYLFLLLCGGISLVIGLVLALILFLRGVEDAGATLSVFVGSVMGTLLVSSVSLPLSFRFGYQKARVIAIGVAGLVAGGLGSLAVIAGLMLHGNDYRFMLIVGVLTVLALIALPISYKISGKIYSKKEF